MSQNGISTFVTLSLGGFDQKILIEGRDRNHPVMIFLHGGPGGPIPFSEGVRGKIPQFTDKFVAVLWDQLGCGINNRAIDNSFTIDMFVDMTCDLIQEMKKRFPNNKIWVFATSWGSILAAKAAQRMYGVLDGVIAFGQVLSDLTLNEEVIHILLKCKLKKKDMLTLRSIASKNTKEIKDVKYVNSLIRKHTEGFLTKGSSYKSTFLMVLHALKSKDYRLRDFIAMFINGYTHNTSLLNELINIDLRDIISDIRIPYYIIQGETDIVTSTSAIVAFVNHLGLPNISVTVIPGCGHMPHDKAQQDMLKGIPI